MNSIQDSYVLSNGVKIPCVGFGTLGLSNDEQAADIIKAAIECGYRHIDTAASYMNEAAVGKAIRDCGLRRSELFITSKLDNPDYGYENSLKEFDKTLDQLGLDYLDLYLICLPLQQTDGWTEINQGSWKALEELYQEGKIKAIGVSNFLEQHIEDLLESAAIAPMVDQLELNPQFIRREAVNYCKDHRMIVEAYSPLIKGQLGQPLLLELASTYNKTPAQLVLHWSIQHGFLPLVKTVSRDRMLENVNIFDFEISSGDIELLKTLEALRPITIP